MLLAELTAYANEKYQLEEQHKWADFPGFSVLCHPQTGKWVALLMRQWDGETGTEIERCDLKCGRDSLVQYRRDYLTPPLRMRGSKWVNIAFDDRTESEIVFQLFDQAIASGNPSGYKIVLGSVLQTDSGGYQDTTLPFAQSGYRPAKEHLPERLREMKRLYEYGRESPESRARNFCRQAVFMQDYEDDVPWEGSFDHYFPTYHDMNTQQLRGYFTWRARLRRGNAQPIPVSAAYVYLYELLNGVGADTPEACLEKLREFETVYLDAGFGDARMRRNLHRWMLEYAVLNCLPQTLVMQAAGPELMERDEALITLQAPEEHTDEEVFSALCFFGGKKAENSPVLTKDPEQGKRLFSAAWRAALAYSWQGRDNFTLCFGEKQRRPWYPLTSAVYDQKTRPASQDYVLSACRSYHCSGGAWQVEAYEKASFDRARLQGFLHETDVRLRRYLKTGRYLRENPADEWARPYIDAVIEADRKAEIEAARPKITIDLSGLERIRRDAVTTRESLLTEEEIEDIEEEIPPAAEDETSDLPLDAVQIQIIRTLLKDGDATEIIRTHHLMPSVVADAINEAFFDEIGDTVLLCEGDALALVEDYAEEIEHYLGGTNNG